MFKALKFSRRIFLYICIILSLFSEETFAKKINLEKVRIKITSHPTLQKISLNLDGFYNVKFFSLSNPYRLVADFKKLSINKKNFIIEKYNKNFIKKIRYGTPEKSFSRIVFEFNKPFVVTKINHSNFNEKHFKYKINLDVSESTHERFNMRKKVLSKNYEKNDLSNNYKFILNKKLIPKIRPKITTKKNKIYFSKNNFYRKSRNYTVFIDAGHGGKDPGAISPNGTYEKDITLQASILLKNSLSKYKDIIVNLSRKNDRYLFLRERIKLAKKFKADVFISLHVDASKNTKARGISVFSLSNKASDIEAKKLALRENSSDLIGSINIEHEDPLIVGNLIKMFQRETMNQSAELARYILYNLNEYALYSRGHRFAGFTVLKSPDIPSILIELGFLTNEIDEKNLKNLKYLTKLSDTLANSIYTYMRSNIISN